jgi:deoxyribonuclease IV
MSETKHRVELTFDDADEYRPEPPAPLEKPAWKNGSIRLGIHTSIAGDIQRALDIAAGLGANTLQIFSSSPRMWDRGMSRISALDADRFRARQKELALGPLVVHCNYLLNLASPDPVLQARSVQAFHRETIRAMSLGADYLVLHPGCSLNRNSASAVTAVAQGLKQAARGLRLGELRILLENTAGQGSSLGSRFEELKAILDACRDLPLGVCVDTAHVFAAGFDIRTSQGLENTLFHIDRTVGINRVAVVHLNDSKAELGSHLDRHEHIGKGKIGLEALGRVLNHPLLSGCAFILETPIDKPGDDKRNVAAAWRLLAAPARTAEAGSDRTRSRARSSPNHPEAIGRLPQRSRGK